MMPHVIGMKALRNLSQRVVLSGVIIQIPKSSTANAVGRVIMVITQALRVRRSDLVKNAVQVVPHVTSNRDFKSPEMGSTLYATIVQNRRGQV